MRVKVAIIGSGPSGLLLGQLLANAGIETVILDRASKDHILGRVRAGVLEEGMVHLMDEAGAGTRMHAEGLPHDGISLAFDGRDHRIDLHGLTGGKRVLIYGQTELTHDLMDKREISGGISVYEAENVMPYDFAGKSPYVTYEKDALRTASTAISSPAATASTAPAASRFRKPPSAPSRKSIPSAGLVFSPTCRR